MEIIYSLMGYGIPVDTLPIDEVTHALKTKNYASFIKVRARIEAERFDDPLDLSDYISDHSVSSDSSNRSTMIECPSFHDVIFRSGKSYMSHPGNMMFRELIEQHIEEHNNATQDRKKNLTWQVMGEVEKKRGRFLEFDRNRGTWIELIDRAVIRHKIATYFKEFRRKAKARQKLQNIDSSTNDFVAETESPKKKQKSSTC